jgi:hypothetical protein
LELSREEALFDELIEEVSRVFSHNSLDGLLGAELVKLLEEKSFSVQDKRRIDFLIETFLNDLFSKNVKFERLFKELTMLEMPLEQVRTEIELRKEVIIGRIAESNNVVASRACWICNEKACSTATDLVLWGTGAHHQLDFIQTGAILLGFLGRAVHCD